MSKRTLLMLICCVLMALLTPLNETARTAGTTNRLAQNRLAQNRLAQNRLAQNRLALNSLLSRRRIAVGETQQMLATEEGRQLYSYIISCAVPAGVAIEAQVPLAADSAPPNSLHTCSSGHCVFPGALGLAEEWLDRKLSRSGQRWVSACLLARVNEFEMTEAISLRGRHPNLAVGIDEAEIFTLQEGAFYGNLFRTGNDNDDDEDDDEDTDDAPGAAEQIEGYACLGQGQASGEGGGLGLRDCTEPDPNDPTRTKCGFKFAGECADSSPAFPSPFACTVFDAAQGVYDYCQTRPTIRRQRPSRTFREVITVYVGP